MTAQSKKNLKKRKKKNKKRLEHTNKPSSKPVLNAKNFRYEVSDRINATSHGGIGVIHKMAQLLNIPEILNHHVKIFKIHNPYFESDHILNMAYNIVCGGRYIEDLELLRTDDAYMDALGAIRIPDPTTAGDFLRRFTTEHIESLQNANLEIIKKIWNITNDNKKRPIAILNIDGMLVNTTGEYKEKSNFTYKKGFGFSTLILTEATTETHLYTINRGGEVLSQHEAEKWIYRAIEDLKEHFKRIIIRGDSAYYLVDMVKTLEEQGIEFIFSVDRFSTLMSTAEHKDEKDWELVEREKKEVIREHGKKNVKLEAIIEKGYNFIRQSHEHISEFSYSPSNDKNSYRMLTVRQNKTVIERWLFKNSYYDFFFYITNIKDKNSFELLKLARQRCDHENKIEQLKNGVFAMNMPTKEFLANYAYMIICSMAWNMKSYLGLLMPDKELGEKVVKMEYKNFKMYFINIPCQIIKEAKYIKYRLLGCNMYTEKLLDTFTKLCNMEVTT